MVGGSALGLLSLARAVRPFFEALVILASLVAGSSYKTRTQPEGIFQALSNSWGVSKGASHNGQSKPFCFRHPKKNEHVGKSSLVLPFHHRLFSGAHAFL